MIEKFKHITTILKDKGFCEREVPPLKQVKGYLKQVKYVGSNVLNHINDTNVIEK